MNNDQNNNNDMLIDEMNDDIYKVQNDRGENNTTEISNNWKNKIIVFLASQTLSLFGSSLVQYAISWYITLTTQSGIMMTLSIICGFLPVFFLSPFAGVWADRYNRKILIILADVLIALATLIIALVFMMGYREIWLLLVVSAVRALGTAIQAPAVNAFIPQIVPQDKLTKVIATNTSIQSLIMLASPMLSGFLLTIATIETIFFIDVATAATAVLTLLFFLHVPTHSKALDRQKTSYTRDLREGYFYIRNHSFVKTIFLFCAAFFFLAGPVAFLTPLQVARSFGSDVWRLTAIEVIFSAGMMAGGLLIATWGGFENKTHTMVLSSSLTGLCTLALGVTPNFWIYLVFMGTIGIVMPAFNTPFTVLLQQKVDADFLGRVFGVLGMISSVMMPLSMLVFGPVADLIKIEWLLIGTGILMIVESYLMLRNKVMFEAGRPA